MKKTYIIPSTESVAFHAGSICDISVGGGTLGGGGETNTGGSPIVDPL